MDHTQPHKLVIRFESGDRNQFMASGFNAPEVR